jgi:predicted ArsR family transcriptional regulator
MLSSPLPLKQQDGNPGMMERTVQPVRRRITEILRENGSATVAELADQLGMAPVSVRHHLDILVSEDLVELDGLRRRDGAGRPSQVYALTEGANKLFPQRHDILADHLLSELKAALPEAVVRGVLQRVAERTVREAPMPDSNQTVEERLDQVTGFLTNQGYDARWVTSNDHYELHTCNCPYAGVSDRHPEICLMDQALLQQLIPGAIRLETRVLNGAAHCRYLIPDQESAEPTGSESKGNA